MKIPHSTKASEDLLLSLMPEGEDTTLRPMFGNLAAFTRGNMFVGVFGEELFVRLSERDRTELLKNAGASTFEPIAGRKMKEYVVLPKSWRSDKAKLSPWVAKALDWSSKLPAKKPKNR